MPPVKQPPQPPPVFSIQVANGLYLDNQNHFHSGALPDAPVYQMGGGVLSLHSEVTGGVLSGQLAILPLKDVPGWAKKLSELGVADETIELFGKAADLASNIVMVVGWVQAAFKIGQMLGLFKQGKSVEQLVQDVLTKLGLVQEMVALAHWQNVKIQIESSMAEIEGKRGHVEADMRTLANLNVHERKAKRKEMLDAARAADIQVRELLKESRWELFNQNKQYQGIWYGATSEEIKIENPPYWGASGAWAGPRKQLANDGTTWADAVYPPAYEVRFDYRAALPATLAGVMSYLTMVTMAEPEFRSTGHVKEALTDMAKALDALMLKMRAVLVRTHYEAHHFVYAGHEYEIVADSPDGIADPPSKIYFKLPHFYWAVGALDLCSHTLQHFATLSAQLPPQVFINPLKPGWSRLGVHEFDWLPPSPQLVFVPSPYPLNPIYQGPAPHWEIVNGQECADAANRQSEADLVLLMQSSGYFQLVQLAATLRHLATDPDQSETVTGNVVRRRRLTGSSSVVVVGRDGLLCDPADVTATGTLEQFACRTVASIELQPPDRWNQIPTRILLVALSEPAESDYAVVISEVDLIPGTGPVTLPAAETFDWYVEKRLIGDQWLRPTHKQLSGMSGSTQVAFSYTGPANATAKRQWMRIGEVVSGAPLPEGEPRNRRQESVTFDCTYSNTTTDTRRSAWVELKTTPGSRNADNVYVAVEETLGSGEPLRTYFDMRMHPQLTILPASFFRAERNCLDKTTELIDYIETRFSESAPNLPPHVPVTVSGVVRHLANLRASSPAVVTRALRALSQDSDRA